jgi:hypothetical protein
MKRIKRWKIDVTAVAGIYALVLAAPSAAQQTTDASKITLNRLFDSRDFFPERFGSTRWLESGSAYTTLESNANGSGRDLVMYDAASGEREVLVVATQLVPEGATDPLEIQNYEWSPDASKLLIYTNSKRVWRFNSRGDYWVLNLDTGALRQMGADRPESSLMYGKFDPSGDRFGYVSENDLYVEDVEIGEVVQLTFDGSETIINGNFDWVYEEEFFMPLPADGWRWAPDGESIAYWQLDAQQYRLDLLLHDSCPVPEGRHEELSRAHGRREGEWRRDDVVRRARRPAEQLHPAHGVVRERRRGSDTTHEPTTGRPAPCSLRRTLPTWTRSMIGSGSTATVV